MPASATAPRVAGARVVDRALAALVALVALAALLRFWRIGHQSFWLDESFTVDLTTGSFGDLLPGIARTESTPPLYYLLAWVWQHAFGHGEAALRSLSAVIGTLTVPVAWAAARELFSRRVALVTAALVAVNPYLVWFSQEARSYALLVLLATASLWALARALHDPSRRTLAVWAVVAVAAMCTHYFAGFLLAPEAAWLVWVTRERAAWAAAGAWLASCVALVPLALHQRSLGHTDFIREFGLARRLEDLPKKVVTGELGSSLPAIGIVAGALVVGGVALAVARADDERTRMRALLLLALGGVAAGVPVVLALAGVDYLLPRNVIAAFVPLIVLVAAGYGAARSGRAGAAAATILCLTGVVVVIETAYDAELQRDDWRGAAAALGPRYVPRAIVLTPAVQAKVFQLYAGAMPALPPAGAAVREIDLVGEGRPPAFAEPPVPPGFHVVARRRTASYELIRYQSRVPVTATPARLAASKLGTKRPLVLFQP